MHRCIGNTLATDALLVKHQAIDIHSAQYICIVLNHLHTEMLQHKKKNTFWKKYPVV